MARQREDWLIAITKKRGGEIALILQQLLITGRRQGHVTAEDAHNISVSHPNVRGAAMKYLRKCGFGKSMMAVTGTTKQSHGHWMFQWVLKDDLTAQGVSDRLTGAVLDLKREPNGQGTLL